MRRTLVCIAIVAILIATIIPIAYAAPPNDQIVLITPNLDRHIFQGSSVNGAGVQLLSATTDNLSISADAISNQSLAIVYIDYTAKFLSLTASWYNNVTAFTYVSFLH